MTRVKSKNIRFTIDSIRRLVNQGTLNSRQKDAVKNALKKIDHGLRIKNLKMVKQGINEFCRVFIVIVEK
jgi:hypothetical protein